MTLKHFEIYLVLTLVALMSHQAVGAEETWAELNQAAREAHQSGDYPTGVDYAERALAKAQSQFGETHSNTFRSFDRLARLYQAQGRFEVAEAMYKKNLTLRTRTLGEKHPDTLTSLNNLAVFYQARGRYETAEPMYQKSLALRIEVLGEKHPSTLTSFNNLATLYRALGRYELAEPMYEKVLALRTETLGETDPRTLRSINNLARLYEVLGRYSIAESMYKKNLLLRRTVLGEKHPATIVSINNLAALYVAQGRYELAEPMYRKSLALLIEARGEKHANTITSINNLAFLYKAQGRYDLAEPMFQRSLALATEVLGEKHPYTLGGLNNLALLYQAEGKYELAEPMLRKTLALRTEILGENHPDTIMILNNLAYLYQEQKRYELAEPMFVKSLAQRTEVLGEKHPDTITSLKNLALVYHALGRYKLAEPMFRKSLTLSTEVLGDKHPISLLSLSNLAIAKAHTGEFDPAFGLWQTYLRNSNAFLNDNLWGASEATRRAYMKQQISFRDSFLSVSLQLDTGRSATEVLNYSLTRKGLLLHISAQVSALAKASTNPIVATLAMELSQLKHSLSSLAAAAADEGTHSKSVQLGGRIEELEADLGRRIGALGRAQRQVRPADVVSALTPQQGLIDFHLFFSEREGQTSENLMAVWVDPNNEQPIRLIDLGEFATVAALISDYRTGLDTFDNHGVTAMGRKLYSRLWKPLESLMADKLEIFIIPDGLLHLLPFPTLINRENQYLVETVKLSVIASARDLVLKPIAAKQQPVVIFVAPLYDPLQRDTYLNIETNRQTVTTRESLNELYFSPLPGALVEGQAIAELFAAEQQRYEYYQLETATEAQLRSVVSPRVLHIATHGFFLKPSAASEKTEENPLLRAGLALTNANLSLGISVNDRLDSSDDGILTALEALSLNLEGTELVVLSACESGVGDIDTGEGVYGLQRSFIEAGASAVLYSLWRIDDLATVVFMKKFYGHFISGEKPQEALRLTQLEMLNHPRWSLPFFWAGFVLSGRE